MVDLQKFDGKIDIIPPDSLLFFRESGGIVSKEKGAQTVTVLFALLFNGIESFRYGDIDIFLKSKVCIHKLIERFKIPTMIRRGWIRHFCAVLVVE